MAKQVENGKGFEWAVAAATSELLSVSITDSDEVRYAANCFRNLAPAKQKLFRACAEKSVSYVADVEGLRPDAAGSVNLSPDSAGAHGDVRDVVLSVNGREIGISCKTNHEAFKHSRLSGTIDFAAKWGLGAGCSDTYWEKVRPIFSELAAIRKKSLSTAKWSDIDGYQERYYLPVLDAWKEELLRIAGGDDPASKEAAKALCQYIIGRIDFWKIISESNQVKMFAFNTQKSLGTSKTKLPSQILGIDRIDGSKYSLNVRLNEGYQFNFRIHNASSRVEPSLKFDVQSEGLPGHIHQHDIYIR
jgi:hypothetical protein